MKKEISKESSINDIIDSLGIKREGVFPDEVFWVYEGKRITRPSIRASWLVVKKKFNIDCEFLKVDKYYTE